MNNVNIGNSIIVSARHVAGTPRKHTFKHVGPDQWEYISSLGFVMLLSTNEAKTQYNKLLRHPSYVTNVSSPKPKQKKPRTNNK